MKYVSQYFGISLNDIILWINKKKLSIFSHLLQEHRNYDIGHDKLEKFSIKQSFKQLDFNNIIYH